MIINGVSDKYDARLHRLKKDGVLYIQVDTTGLTAHNDVITRLTILDEGYVVYDQVFKCDAGKLTRKAAEVSGITRDDLREATVTFADALPNLKEQLMGRLLCCCNKDFMLSFLEAEGLSLNRDDIIDLRAIVGQMNHTYSRTTMEDVLRKLTPPDMDDTMPATTWERNFKMYECACTLRDMIP